ncbi:MAG TPA: hypothetical protein VEH84_15620 [Alphaproteobacteria bacterium]|nr:hypothetical protein [Alphaproteobacteria bacterium]
MRAPLPVLAALALIAAPAAADPGRAAELADKKAAVLELMHGKAKRDLVNVAQDEAFARYFAATDEAGRADAKARIERIALATQSRFAVEEMCLIDPHGHEIMRIVGSSVAHDLSHEEASAPFFAPAFDQPPRSVHISEAYLSPDTDRWVVAYVTPVMAGGRKAAVLHYEHRLDTYQAALRGATTEGWAALVGEDGLVLADTRGDPPVQRRGEQEARADYFTPFALAGLSLDQLKQRLGGGAAGSGWIDSPGGAVAVAYRQSERWTVVAALPDRAAPSQ